MIPLLSENRWLCVYALLFFLQIISEPSDNALVGQTLKHPAGRVSFEGVETDDLQDNTSQNLQHDLEKDTLSELSPGLINDQSNFLFLWLLLGCVN